MMTDLDNIWGNNNAQTDDATVAADAHWSARMTWDYFKNVHNRDGIKNDGKGAPSGVHFGTNYANAFWDDMCFCMVYGDGDGKYFTP